MSGRLFYHRDESISIKAFHSLQHVHLAQRHMFGRECYDFWVMVYVMDGSLHTNAGNAFYILPKGALILYEPFEFYILDVDDNSYADLFIMSFEITGPATNKLKQRPLSLDDIQKANIQHIIDLCTDDFSAEPVTYPKNPEAFYINYHQRFLEKPYFLPKVCALTEFLLLCLCDVTFPKISSVTNYETLTFFALTEDMKNYRNKFFTIDELSKLHNISPTKAKTLIKKYSGLSLHKYYLSLKISQSLVLFRQGYNITQTSLELGFCNPNHFSTIFKRITGDSPSQYLRKLKEVL